MFDIGMWELLVVGTVALLVVGPKELPGLLRTIGKYAGMLKRQANDFKAQFNEAIQESEFQELKRDVESMGDDAEASLREASEDVAEGMSEFDDEDLMEEEFDDFDLEEALTTEAAKTDPLNKDKSEGAGAANHKKSASQRKTPTAEEAERDKAERDKAEIERAELGEEESSGATEPADEAEVKTVDSSVAKAPASSGVTEATTDVPLNGVIATVGHDDIAERAAQSSVASAQRTATGSKS